PEIRRLPPPARQSFAPVSRRACRSAAGASSHARARTAFSAWPSNAASLILHLNRLAELLAEIAEVRLHSRGESQDESRHEPEDRIANLAILRDAHEAAAVDSRDFRGPRAAERQIRIGDFGNQPARWVHLDCLHRKRSAVTIDFAPCRQIVCARYRFDALHVRAP